MFYIVALVLNIAAVAVNIVSYRATGSYINLFFIGLCSICAGIDIIGLLA